MCYFIERTQKCTKLFFNHYLALLIVVEITLRLVWGFGKMPLYAVSDKYEYMALPNQSGVRLGN